MIVAALVMSILGLTACSLRACFRLRASWLSRSARAMMSRGLRIAVRQQNIRQAVAALRVKREIALETVGSETDTRTCLYARIEKIRLRSLMDSKRRTPAIAMAGAAGRRRTSRRGGAPRGTEANAAALGTKPLPIDALCSNRTWVPEAAATLGFHVRAY